MNNVGRPVIYESYHFLGKGKPRAASLSYGIITYENSAKYKIKNIRNGKEVWRNKEDVRN